MAEYLTWKTGIAVIIFVLALVVGIVSIKYLGPNNQVEEIAEDVIKKETGIDVEFSPSATPTPSITSPSQPQPSSSTPDITPKPPG